MTNSEMVSVLIAMFRDYFTFLLPVMGLLAGVHVIVRLLWSVTFKPFVR